jgi:hypothetical protein
MPSYVVELDGHEIEVESDHPPTEADVRKALGSAQLPGAKPEAPGALETAGREAALGVAPSAAAAAAFVPGMAAGAPFAEFAGPAAPLVPLATGAVASLLAGGAAEFGQQKLLQKLAPGFLEKTAAGAQEHPVAAGIGRVASAAPSFAFAPGQSIEGALALPRVLRGTAIDAEKKAAGALFAQLGAQTGITAAQTGLMEHRLPTAPELLESAAVAGLYGHPRFSLPIPKTLEKGLRDYATQKRQREESRQREYPGTEAQRVSTEAGGGHRPSPAAGLEEETSLSLEPQSPQVPPHGPRVSADPFGNPAITESLLSKGYGQLDIPSRSDVKQRVLRAIENPEVFKSVVSSIPVNVVDDLSRQEGTPNNLFGDNAVLINYLSSDEGQPVKARIIDVVARAYATSAAKDPSILRAGVSGVPLEKGAAVEALQGDVGHIPKPTTETVPFQPPLISGSEATGFTLRFQGKTETGFKTSEEAEKAAMAVMAGERQMSGAAEPAPATRQVEPDLVEQMERAAIDAGEEAGVPITPVDKLTGEDVPFAGHGIWLAATGTGAELHRGEFKKQIQLWRQQDFSPDQIRELVISGVNEEKVHNIVTANSTPEQVEGYWGDLTPLEKKLELYIYTGKTTPGKLDTPFRMGHEAIRRRLQKAMRLPVREFLETVGRERWKLRGLDLLGDMVRRTRELVGTKASARQRALFDRALGNINAAKAALSGLGPGAQRREQPEEHITAAAFITPEGTLETGANHPEILERLGIKGYEKAESRNTKDFGFVTSTGRFIDRQEAGPLAERTGQALKDFEPGEPVHSDEVRAPGSTQPISEMGPGARRRYLKSAAQQREEERAREQGQAQAFGQQVRGLGSAIPPTPAEHRVVETARPAGQLETAAAHIFSGFMPPVEARQGEVIGPPIRTPVEPTFQNFLKWARRNVSETVPQGPLFDVWLDTVNKTIENAPGSKLNDLVESLDIRHRVYPWKKKYPGAPRDYTRVEIPDFQQIPPDPNRLPLSIEAAIRQRVLESEIFPETATEEDIQKAQDKAVEGARREVMSLIPEERRKELLEVRKAIIQRQKLRSKALSAIYQKVIEEGMPTITDLTPTDINAEDIAFDNPNAKNFGAYHTITPDERKNPDKLKAIFSEEARRKDWPVSNSRKLAVMLNRNTGEVALVSAYIDPRKGLRVVEPSGATGKRGKPHVQIASPMQRGWEPIIAILRRDPVRGFYKGFDDIADYNRYLGREAAELDRSSTEEFVGSRPEDALADVPEDSSQAWRQEVYAREPTEHDLTRIMEERERPTEEFVGPMPSEVVGEEFRPGTAVERGEGGSFTGPQADIARMGPGRRLESSPLSTREALALHNWLNDPEEWGGTAPIKAEIESTTTKPEMREALQRLCDLAANNKLKPRQWNAIVALRKMAIEQHRRDRLEFRDMLRDLRSELRGATREQRQAAIESAERYRPTPESSMVTALDRLYEINQISESQADYLSHTMGEFARPVPEAKGPTPVQGPETARELALPRFARKSVPVEPLPAGLGKRTEPSPSELLTPEAVNAIAAQAAKEFPYDPTQVLRSLPVTESKVGGEKFTGLPPKGTPKLMPHEFRDEPRVYPKKGRDIEAERLKQLGPGASIREIKDRVKREWEEAAYSAKKGTIIPLKRSQTEHDIRAGADGADRQLDLYANRLANDIRIASVKEGAAKKLSLKDKLLGGVLFNKDARLVREAAKASIAAEAEANKAEWSRVANEWARIMRQRETTGGHEERPVYKKPGPEDIKPEHFDPLIVRVQKGIQDAEQQLKSPTVAQRIIARQWRAAAQKLLAEVEYAKKHYNDPEMRKTVEVFRAVMGQHLENMNAYGMNVTGRDYYVPGRYQGEVWNDDTLTWGDMRILGRNYRLPKTFSSYYEAISYGPYTPVNYDIADLAQHSLASGGRIMARETWFEGLKDVIDPHSKKPVAIEPAWGLIKPAEMSQAAFDEFIAELRSRVGVGKPVPPELLMSLLKQLGVTKKPWGFTVPKGKEEYSLVYPTPNSKPLAVREGYRQLVQTAMASSEIQKMPVLRGALTASQMLKHGLILIIDTFHPGRLMQYAGALSGKNLWGMDRPGFNKGLSALMWNPESLDEAVKIGALTQKQVDWARAPLEIHDRGAIKRMSRQELLRLLLSRGLNATQTADTLHRNSIQKIPYIGNQWNQLLSPLNKWIFERITPGIIAESAVANLERINAGNKHLSLDSQVREVVRDMNVFYGNLGRNGIFKNPTARDLAQILLLAPLWQEGLIGKELRTLSRVSGVSYALGRRGLGADVYFGPLVRGIVRGLGAYFVLSQMINLASRGKWTFQNDEPEHKLDAWMPLGPEGLWLSPLSVFGEVTQSLVRLAESKPKTWDAITQYGRNKLGPIGRLIVVLGEGKSPTGEDITTTGGVLGRAARELAPAPISIGTYAQAALPDVFGKPRPGAVPQRALSAVGIKTEIGTRAETGVRRLARKFVTENNLSYEPLEFTPTDLASYAKLRGALRNDDEKSAARILKELRQHRSDSQILKAMRLEAERPFTGSKANETMFQYSLSDKELSLYFKASMERAELYQRFLDWYVRQP